MNDGFYRAFEEKFRCSRELIKSRLQVYLPFVIPLLDLHEKATAIDLGCGRGEWLELLDEIGFQTYGVDLDSGMLAACHERELNVDTKDAIEALKELADESQVVVSGFHFVEHIPFSNLQVLVREALRVLKPAGLLIMETPNPENIVVATRNFYLDPTHQRPIPPELLYFLPEYYGFGRIKILRLQEHAQLADTEELQLIDVLGGVSPDYAVIAQKPADLEMLTATVAAFEKDYGFNLETLATRYNQTIANSIGRAESAAQAAENRAQQAESAAQAAESRAQQAESAAQAAESRAQQAESAAQAAENWAQQLAAELQGVYTGSSWRITKPLRWVGMQARLLRQKGLASRIKSFGEKLVGPIIHRAILFVSLRSGLRFKCALLAHKLGLYDSLRSLYCRFSGQYFQKNLTGMNEQPHELIEHLTPRARQIYHELKVAVEKNKGAL